MKKAIVITIFVVIIIIVSYFIYKNSNTTTKPNSGSSSGSNNTSGGSSGNSTTNTSNWHSKVPESVYNNLSEIHRQIIDDFDILYSKNSTSVDISILFSKYDPFGFAKVNYVMDTIYKKYI